MNVKPPIDSKHQYEKSHARKSKAKVRWLLTYYPLRYYAVAFFSAYVLLHYGEVVKQVEGQVIVSILHFFQVYSFYLDGQIFVGNFYSQLGVDLPLSVQILFLTFFCTVVATARINISKRLQILVFGLLCFLVLIITETITIVATVNFMPGMLYMITFWTQMFAGSAMIMLTLFTTLTLPRQRKIKRVIKRSYIREYLYLTVLLVIAAATAYFINGLLNIQKDHPIVPLLYLGGISLFFYAYVLAFLISETRTPDWLKVGSNNNKRSRSNYDRLSLSFLIPAYNEEKKIRKCIESVDLAASKYDGPTEIVIVNDGSTDNTPKIVHETIGNLKHCKGNLYTIKNSGKGFALKYGLQRTSGDIIFRMDADSVVDEYAIAPIMLHFRDPMVGSVSGFVVMPDEKNMWVRTLNLWFIFTVWSKKGQDLLDSIITQAGPCSVFRRDTLIEVGGWTDNIFGEDGDLTTRMSRSGYRNEFEHRALMYAEVPPTLTGVVHQRARWGVAYYHSRGINLAHIKEFYTPRSIIFLANVIGHGHAFMIGLLIPNLLASVLVGIMTPSIPDTIPFIQTMLSKLIEIRALIFAFEIITFAYYLRKFHRDTSDVKYFFPFQLFNIIVVVLITPQVMEVLLSWSARWKEYNNESFKDLRKEVRKAIDPDY